jgi:electron transfer flavoprotein beta subunit
MNTVVLLKQVHDPNTPRTALRIGVDGRSLQLLTGSATILNGYDANALEESIRVKEKRGGSVTAIALGADAVKESLRRAIAMGADKGIHIKGSSGLETDGTVTATILAAAIRSVGDVSLVLAGRSASDTDGGVVPLLVAALLGMPALTPVRSLDFDEGGALLVERITDSGVRRVRISGAAVLGVSSEINKPRSPQLKGVAAAKRAVIPTLTMPELGIETLTPAVRLERLFLPPPPQTVVEMITAASAAEAGRALADRLKQEGLVR